MRITKAGLRIIEDGDPVPSGNSAIDQLLLMVNELRKELNKTAEAIDKLQEQIDELKGKGVEV